MTDYTDIKALNFSTLKYMDVSPLAYQYALTHPRADTDAMRLGRAVHTAVLEGKKFPEEYVVFDGARRAGKEWEAFKIDAGFAEILKRSEYEDCLKIHDAVWMNDAAADALENTMRELTVKWEHDGRPCKGRVDGLGPGSLIDLKTAKDVSPRGFGRAAASYLYHVQMAWYQWGLALAGHAVRDVIIIAAQNVEPWDVAVYRLDDKALAAGERVFFGWLERLAECEQANKWPGAVEGVADLELPAWALGEDEPEWEVE